MRRWIVGFALLAALAIAGCGSGHQAAQVKSCTESQREERPLACEKQDATAERQAESSDPQLKQANQELAKSQHEDRLMLEAQQRAKKTPRTAGETVSEHEQRAREEIEAEQASG
jgi:hypothetical protein